MAELKVKNNQKKYFRFFIIKLVKAVFKRIKNLILTVYFWLAPDNYFVFRDKMHPYFRHIYNKAYENERTVEVPIIWEEIKKAESGKILEVGNVIRNYYPKSSHDVLDKYEKGKNIINEDVNEFKTDKKYDLIVSISTMEHVGWDETPRLPEKVIRAFKNLKENCLVDNGKIIFTIPLGYNRMLDEFLRSNKLSFTEQYFLKRISPDNHWAEVGYNEVKEAIYGYPFPNANAIMVGIERKD
ncbi:hypothetical protein HZB05_02490 [Candidatus Wolfebacteria bacterium]|nr:hypothetical protein [Candidatus Wolfebacteria bacterium]